MRADLLLERLVELRALRKAATPGEWFATDAPWRGLKFGVAACSDHTQPVILACHKVDAEADRCNAVYIAAIHNVLPSLLDAAARGLHRGPLPNETWQEELDRALAERDRLVELLREYRDYHGTDLDACHYVTIWDHSVTPATSRTVDQRCPLCRRTDALLDPQSAPGAAQPKGSR